jgi:glycerophosphoryl diester phosphodiesterase
MPGVWNIAHRGASLERPENTLAAFEEAIRQGADVLEADVRMTVDGELVVINDETVDRTTDGRGPVRELDYAHVRRLDAGGGERIPTPDEVLDLARGRARVVFDVKEADAVDTLVAMVQEFEMTEGVTFSTFSPEASERLREAASDNPVMTLVESAIAIVSLVPGHVGAGFGIPAALISPEITNSIRRRGFGVYAWTVDEPEEMARLVDCGVNGIVTNRPAVLAAVLNERGVARS